LLDQGKKCFYLPVNELREWAIGLRGNAQTVLGLIEGQEIIHQEEFAKDSLYVVIRRDLSSPDLRDFLQEGLGKARQSGVELLPVSINDLCVYLTAKTKGGIDDVFTRG